MPAATRTSWGPASKNREAAPEATAKASVVTNAPYRSGADMIASMRSGAERGEHAFDRRVVAGRAAAVLEPEPSLRRDDVGSAELQGVALGPPLPEAGAHGAGGAPERLRVAERREKAALQAQSPVARQSSLRVCSPPSRSRIKALAAAFGTASLT